MKINIIKNSTAKTAMPATTPTIMPIEKPPESLEPEGGGANKFYA